MKKIISLFNNYPSKFIIFAASYFAAGKVSLLLAIPPGFAVPVWIPAGIALSSILFGGYRYLPSIFVGSFCTNIMIAISTGGSISSVKPIIVASSIAVGAMLQVWLSAFLIKRVVDFPCRLEKGKDIFFVMMFGGPLGCVVNATLGSTTILVAGFIDFNAYLVNWLTWWAGDVIGSILFAPLIIILFTSGINFSRKLSVSLPILFFLCLIIFAFSYTRKSEMDSIKSNFREMSLYEFENLEKKMEIYKEILELSGGFYSASNFVDRNEFSLFSNSVIHNHNEIKAIGWVPYIKNSDKNEMEKLAWEDGYKNFHLNNENQLYYLPIYYVEPYQKNINIFSLDLYNIKPAVAAIHDAMDSGNQISSKSIKIQYGDTEKNVLFIFKPVYQHNISIETIGDRRKYITGFTFIMFVVDDLLEDFVDSLKTKLVDVYVYDNYIQGDEAILYGAENKNALFLDKLALEVSGRQWTVEFTPSHSFLGMRRWQAWSVIIGGLLFSALLQAFLLIMSARSETIKKIVYERTAELEDSETKHRAVLDNAAEGLITIDTDGIIKSFNPACEKIFGYRAGEAIGQNINLLMVGQDKENHDKYLSDYKKTGKINIIGKGREVFARRKDGFVFPAELSVSEIRLTNTTFYSGIIRDISERKAAEAKLAKYTSELEEARDKAEESTRLKSEFLANMSHEIRTPMNGVIGMTSLLMDTNLNAEQKSYAQTVLSSANLLLEIINDILDLSKIEAGKLDMELLPFDLQTLVEDTAEIVSFKCIDKKLDVLIDYPNDVPRYVVGDSGRVRQIILNLLSNAIKFTEEGYVLISVKVDGVDDNGMLKFRFEVEDTGCGIPEDKFSIIFNKFDQADQSTTRKYGGTGLGLAICKQLTEMMGGNIGVRSKIGQGTTFWFNIELMPNTDEAFESKSFRDVDLQGIKTLVVSDNKLLVNIIKKQLSSYNVIVDGVNFEDKLIQVMLEKAENGNAYDIILFDKSLEENEFNICSSIKEHERLKDSIIVLLTSSPLKDDGSKLKNIGFSGYITKPIRSSEFPFILHKLISAKKENNDNILLTRNNIKELSVEKRKKILISKASVLLVEDNRVNLAVAFKMLENIGCKVATAMNGKEAVEAFKNQKFDLIFMDCQMPEMDGFEATKIIRDIEKNNDIKPSIIVAFTANAMKEDRDRCIESGMNDHIPKPVKPEMLEDILHKWLR